MVSMNVAILGSTGSIGTQALEVAARFPDRIRVVALSTNTHVELLAEQARTFGVRHLAIGDQFASGTPESVAFPENARIGYGAKAIEELATLDEVDVVLNALVGASGLRVSHTALTRGKRLALANKESLVVGGDLLMPLVAGSPRKDALIPVDSEHSALFQCLLGEQLEEIDNLWITASGGPFRNRSRADLQTVTSEEALRHPTWKMGPKITVDSATLMNKGLEVIEAHHLFGIPYEKIQVVVHPQSCIHSLIAFKDGSIKAHMGVTDMRIPIQYALSYPARWEASTSPLDLTQLADLSFKAPDLETFGCLALALQAGRVGGTAPAVLNAANEAAVAAFLAGKCGFLDIEQMVESVLSRHEPQQVVSLEQLEEVDSWARMHTRFARRIYHSLPGRR